MPGDVCVRIVEGILVWGSTHLPIDTPGEHPIINSGDGQRGSAHVILRVASDE